MSSLFEDRATLLFQLGRESADEWLSEREERLNLEHFRALGDEDLVQYTLGRLSTIPGYESEVQRG